MEANIARHPLDEGVRTFDENMRKILFEARSKQIDAKDAKRKQILLRLPNWCRFSVETDRSLSPNGFTVGGEGWGEGGP